MDRGHREISIAPGIAFDGRFQFIKRTLKKVFAMSDNWLGLRGSPFAPVSHRDAKENSLHTRGTVNQRDSTN